MSENRWFSTGYLANGVEAVNAEAHELTGAAVIRPGEAKGHGLWIDAAFCARVAELAASFGQKGVKARFGHPDMCSDALGTFLGRWTDFAVGEDGVVRGTLHLSSTASESPKGDLRKYIEEMAAKEPDHFGCSIVFTRDEEAENEFQNANTQEQDEIGPDGIATGRKLATFRSPDPANVGNLRHARLLAIHAADLVDDPAATDGMFSGLGGTALAARVSEWLDTHPEILNALSGDDEMVSILERYPDKIAPFIAKFSKNREADPPAVVDPVPQVSPEALAQSKAEADEAAKALENANAELTQCKADLASCKSASDATAQDLIKSNEQLTKAIAERDAALAKLAAIEAGQPPVSSVPATESASAGSVWDRARRSKK